MDFYNHTITELYRNTHHAGELSGKNVHTAASGNPGQSDVVQLYIVMNNQHIEQAQFQAHGTMTTIAGAEYLCQQLKGKTIHEVKDIDMQSIKAALELPTHRVSSALLVNDAWQQVLNTLL